MWEWFPQSRRVLLLRDVLEVHYGRHGHVVFWGSTAPQEDCTRLTGVSLRDLSVFLTRQFHSCGRNSAMKGHFMSLLLGLVALLSQDISRCSIPTARTCKNNTQVAFALCAKEQRNTTKWHTIEKTMNVLRLTTSYNDVRRSHILWWQLKISQRRISREVLHDEDLIWDPTCERQLT